MKNKLMKVLICSWFCHLAVAFAAVKPAPVEQAAQVVMVWPEISA